MNTKSQKNTLEVFKQFTTYRMLILKHMYEDKPLEPDSAISKYLASLMYQRVTSKSQFIDSIWDYSEDAHGSSVNCRGSNLVIDYDKYENIPKFVITEVKCVTHLYMLHPGSFMRNGRKKKVIKPNTLVKVTKDGLAFLDTVYSTLSSKYGSEYIQREHYSLTEVGRDIFEEAATVHDYAYCTDCKIFLENLNHSFAKKNIFGQMIESDLSETFDWNKISGNIKIIPAQKIIPDQVYEKLVLYSSLIITDFLLSQGIEPEDKITLKHLRIESHGLGLCIDKGIDHTSFNAYAALRLNAAKYDYDFISSQLDDIENNQLSSGRNGIASPAIMIQRINSMGFSFQEIKNHLGIIKYACQYLIAQFTGMRPSELAEVPINCFCEEGGIALIKSRVLKHRENLYKGLFDDKWIVIPCLKDALSALSLLNKIHQSDYLFSSLKTAKVGSSLAQLTSSSFSHQINLLLEAFFCTSNPNGLKFNTYMIRHTLAYQLFRADLGLSFISYQLKHFVDAVKKHSKLGGVSEVTIDYGSIGDKLAYGTRGLRHQAELEAIKSTMDPDGIYLGGKGKEHKERLQKAFRGYIEAGYSKEEIFEALAEQGIALINVGQGFCYGGAFEDFDENIPCIGSLRCNPIRCSNAIVSKSNAQKWRDVYFSNKANLHKPEYADSTDQILEAMNEAKMVLQYLNEEIIL